MLSMATRKLNGHVFIRAGELMLPNVAQFTSGVEQGGEGVGARPFDFDALGGAARRPQLAVHRRCALGRALGAAQPLARRLRRRQDAARRTDRRAAVQGAPARARRLRRRREPRRHRQPQSGASGDDRSRRRPDSPHAGERDQHHERRPGAGDTAAARARKAGAYLRARSRVAAAR